MNNHGFRDFLFFIKRGILKLVHLFRLRDLAKKFMAINIIRYEGLNLFWNDNEKQFVPFKFGSTFYSDELKATTKLPENGEWLTLTPNTSPFQLEEISTQLNNVAKIFSMAWILLLIAFFIWFFTIIA